ncbi:hypothetical protein Goshw_002880 [Gossypium schwendimanii]|uniref:Uncharacterized protein n=2 Tax=Gossypium TaxID=3633 RepID=A0A7J9KJ59_GOSSC|nr:hypothetical protein [Gossypium aridum]MBA0846492.1 hypothetical protein [Gossypium schwendimanii]
MERTLFHLFLVLLGFSHIISLNAVSVTRIESLVHGPQVHHVPENPHPVIAEKSSKEGRVFMELNDYPGSGANNRHTPRPQFGRCAGC